MSAGVVGLFAPAPVHTPSRAARPPLRLVASDGTLRSGPCSAPRERFGPSQHLGRSEGVLAKALPDIQLTRRGRLLITFLATVAVFTLALVLATSVNAAAPQIDHATTVSAGQTLSEVAATQLPSLPIHEAVARIQLANGMNTSQIRAGQSLLIPVIP